MGSCDDVHLNAMMERIIIALLPVLGALILPLLMARFSSGSKLRKVEYLLKRTELIDNLLSIHSKKITNDEFPKSQLVNELNDIADIINQSSERQQEHDRIDFEKIPYWKSFYKLPFPGTLLGWVGGGMYYTFSAMTLVSGITIIRQFFEPSIVVELILILVLLTCIFALSAWFGRVLAVKSSRKRQKQM